MDAWSDPDREPERPAWWCAIAAIGVILIVGAAAFALTLGIGAGLRVLGWWW